MFRPTLALSVLVALSSSAILFGADPDSYFAIQVVDDQTGRGVPLVELTTTNRIIYHTDSNGYVAFLEPGLMGQEVHFTIKSHGYEYPADGFGYRGVRLKCIPGQSATVKIKRINIAERLYRITGQGIYRDSVLLGKPVPIQQPVINGLVMGSDSVSTVVHRDRIFWYWGDTGKPSYPLGNFHMTSATSELPENGGLDPDVGVDLTYFTREDGFTREMARFNPKGPTWADGYVVLEDETGRERLYSSYGNVNTKMQAQSRGISVYNDEKEIYESIVEVPLDAPIWLAGHPFKHTVDGTEYIYYNRSLPLQRVKANPAALCDPSTYEAFTCLQPGTRLEEAKIDRDAEGNIRYAWKKNTPVVFPQDERKLVEEGKLAPDEILIYLRDADSGKPLLAHSGSAQWNPHRRRWILIISELFGTSVLGETWYAEADTPVGPWCYARKVITHDTYSSYNPKHHPMFDKENGRIIYFEGTYTKGFSGNPVYTPRYDYNQIMYKLDLDDPRMVLPVPVYTLGDPDRPAAFATHADLPRRGEPRPIAFFAPDRPAPGLIAVTRDGTNVGTPIRNLAAAEITGTRPPNRTVLFYALPADASDPPAATVPLFEYVHSDGRKVWSTDEAWSADGYRRSDQPLCRVWTSPTRLRYPLD